MTAGCLRGNAAAAKLARFSQGFTRVDAVDDALVVSDLRMGLTPSYVFAYVVARRDGRTDVGSMPCGQGAGCIDSLEPAAEIVERVVSEARSVMGLAPQ